mmetsp:Transcript_7262/g.10897  ORF Transcript_7262/g.10897 Transcript_7262/m.10897 type:complete len:404 (-) Transcript_7262:537-1748(-)
MDRLHDGTELFKVDLSVLLYVSLIKHCFHLCPRVRLPEDVGEVLLGDGPALVRVEPVEQLRQLVHGQAPLPRDRLHGGGQELAVVDLPVAAVVHALVELLNLLLRDLHGAQRVAELLPRDDPVHLRVEGDECVPQRAQLRRAQLIRQHHEGGALEEAVLAVVAHGLDHGVAEGLAGGQPLLPDRALVQAEVAEPARRLLGEVEPLQALGRGQPLALLVRVRGQPLGQQGAVGRPALVRPQLEQAAHELLRVRVHLGLGGPAPLQAQHVLYYLAVRLAVEGVAASKHAVGDHPNAPHVALLSVLAAEHLGSHTVGSAQPFTHRQPFHEPPAHAEVDELDLAALVRGVEEDVLSLQVPVAHAPAVAVRDHVAQLAHHLPGLPVAEAAVPQVQPRAQFHHQVELSI